MSKYIYLNEDITLANNEITLTRDVNICLNGHSITGCFIDTTYTLTITSSDLVILDSSQSSAYNKYKGDQTFTAIATDNSTLDVTVNITDVMPATGTNSGKLQIKKSSGILYNKTDLGAISSISCGSLSSSARKGIFQTPRR